MAQPSNTAVVLAYLSVFASLSFIVFAILYVVVYQLLTDTDGLVRNPWVIFPEDAADLAGALLLGAGVLLLGVASFGGQVLGRWGFLPLFLGLLTLFISSFFWLVFYLDLAGVPWSLFLGLLTVLRGLCWVLLGGVL